MSKNEALKTVCKNIGSFIGTHSPEILTGLGISGMVSAVIFAVRATPKAIQLINEAKIKKYEETENEDHTYNPQGDELPNLTVSETVKAVWKCYIPSGALILISGGCLIGSSSVNLKRNTALATAYKLSETALTEYKDKVVDTFGEKKAQSIKDEIAKDKLDRMQISEDEIILTKRGDTLCMDAISGRFFKSDIETIKQVINKLNRRLLSENFISLNELYYELDLDGIKIGDDIGWRIGRGLIELNPSSQLTKNGTPCLVMNFDVVPEYEYSKY